MTVFVSKEPFAAAYGKKKRAIDDHFLHQRSPREVKNLRFAT